jgi:glycosyltransferase involved in cell wall biosynthesis
MLSVICKNRIVLELHNIPTGFRIFLLNFLIKKPLVFLSPISNFLESKFKFDENRYMIAPMAINTSEVVDLCDAKQKNKTIIYVGYPESGGIKLNFSLMNDFAELISRDYPDWIFEVVGFDRNFFENQISKPSSKNFSFLGRVPRQIALSRMRLARIGLVLYENNNYHQFPLKIVEYAASGLTILASNTSIHRRILGNNKCIFYDTTSPESAFLSFRYLQNNPKKSCEIEENLNQWVKGLTYNERVSCILDRVLKDL